MQRSTKRSGLVAMRRACASAAVAAACLVAMPAAAQLSEAAAPVTAEIGRMERYVRDSWITTKVKLAMLDAPDLSALDIGVQTQGGIVQLSGSVDDERLARRAAEIAQRVRGVASVRNSLQVRGELRTRQSALRNL